MAVVLWYEMKTAVVGIQSRLYEEKPDLTDFYIHSYGEHCSPGRTTGFCTTDPSWDTGRRQTNQELEEPPLD